MRSEGLSRNGTKAGLLLTGLSRTAVEASFRLTLIVRYLC